MRAAGELSSHTVCQMPLHGLYHMWSGFLVCFPIGITYPGKSVGSKTKTFLMCFSNASKLEIYNASTKSHPGLLGAHGRDL